MTTVYLNIYSYSCCNVFPSGLNLVLWGHRHSLCACFLELTTFADISVSVCPLCHVLLVLSPICQPWHRDLLGFASKKDQTWSLWNCVFLQMLMLEVWTQNLLWKVSSFPLPFLPNTPSAQQHELPQGKVCYMVRVRSIAPNNSEWMQWLKEKKQGWAVSLVCSLHRECVIHALDAHFTLPHSCAVSRMPAGLCRRAPRSLGSLGCSCSASSHPARLDSGVVEQEGCWGALQEEASALENCLKYIIKQHLNAKKHCLLSHGQECVWDLRLWDSNELRKGSWNCSLDTLILQASLSPPVFLSSHVFFPFLQLPALCYVPREGNAFAFLAPVVWVNRDLLLLTSVHKPCAPLRLLLTKQSIFSAVRNAWLC